MGTHLIVPPELEYGFNRTFLVLKCVDIVEYNAPAPSFNRTFLVLKFKRVSAS